MSGRTYFRHPTAPSAISGYTPALTGLAGVIGGAMAGMQIAVLESDRPVSNKVLTRE